MIMVNNRINYVLNKYIVATVKCCCRFVNGAQTSSLTFSSSKIRCSCGNGPMVHGLSNNHLLPLTILITFFVVCYIVLYFDPFLR
uniref:Uncharacterized protein n=1 Tax=Ciona intestinalis TaxID=7719 RepID=H2XP30_CIOIN